MSLTIPLVLTEIIQHIVIFVCASFVFRADAKFLDDVSASPFSLEAFKGTFPLSQLGNVWAKGQKLKM